MKLWFVSMECAGIAEAGGVKNVTFSLCKEFAKLKNKVTLFIPIFKCNTWDVIADKELAFSNVDVTLCGKTQQVNFYKAICTDGDFNVVFVDHPSFAEKEAVYTYTEHEQALNPEHKKGSGHEDCLFMDVLFQKAIYEYMRKIPKSELPEILHCQDASTATLPAFVAQNNSFKKIQSVVTIHNCGPYYHHNFTSIGEASWYTLLPNDLLEDSLNDTYVEPFLLSANSGAHLTTVSEEYANELLDPKNIELTDGLAPIFYEKHIPIIGITNGFDLERYNPEDKEVSCLPFEFSTEKGDLDGKLKCRKFFIQNYINTDIYKADGVKKYGKLDCDSTYTKEIYIAYHGRVATQKGLNVLADAIPSILLNFPNVRFIIAGQGEPYLEQRMINLTKEYEGKITFLNGYHKVVARLSSAVCDFIVLPSFFEPCGLEDFIAQIYGTLPIAHATGGLNKIIDEKTGFLYHSNTSESLAMKITQAIMIKNLRPSQITKMIKSGANTIKKEYLWKIVIQKKYLPFFKEILKK